MALGKDAKFYVLAGETDTSGNEATIVGLTWLEVCASTCSLSLTADTSDASDRCGNGYKSMVSGLKDFTISLELFKKKTAGVLPTSYTTLRDAFLNTSVVSVLMLDGPLDVIGSDGYLANMEVSDFSEDQPLNESIKNTLQLINSGQSVYAPVSFAVTV